MSGDIVVIGTVAILAISAIAVAVVAYRRGRQRPIRTGPWVTGLVLAALPAGFITMISVPATFLGGSAWLLIGAAGLWALVALTVMNPRWAAWVFVGSGVALPILLTFGSLFTPTGEPVLIEPGSALGVYTLRALVTAGLLLWATWPRHSTHAPTEETTSVA